jgi:hypothetical protein
MAYMFMTKNVRKATQQELINWNLKDTYDANKVIRALESIRISDGQQQHYQQPHAIASSYITMTPAMLYVPQQHPAPFTPNICYHCNRPVTNNLDGYFQLTGCRVNHNLEEDSPPNPAFNVLHIECYDPYLANARQGKIQCKLCDSRRK